MFVCLFVGWLFVCFRRSPTSVAPLDDTRWWAPTSPPEPPPSSKGCQKQQVLPSTARHGCRSAQPCGPSGVVERSARRPAPSECTASSRRRGNGTPLQMQPPPAVIGFSLIHRRGTRAPSKRWPKLCMEPVARASYLALLGRGALLLVAHLHRTGLTCATPCASGSSCTRARARQTCNTHSTACAVLTDGLRMQ